MEKKNRGRRMGYWRGGGLGMHWEWLEEESRDMLGGREMQGEGGCGRSRDVGIR